MLRPSASLSLIAILALAGCGGRLVPAEGTVTVDGKPLERASVIFTPVNIGQPATALTDEKGFFSVRTVDPGDGALPGQYKVTITKTPFVRRPDGFQSADPTAMDEAIRQSEQQRRKAPEVPTIYGDLKRTPLTADVPEEGKRDFQFALKRTP